MLSISRSHIGFATPTPPNQFEELDTLYRLGLKQLEQGALPEALDRYWEQIAEPLFPHWPAPFFEAIATRYRLQCAELGLDLARTWEEHGNLTRARAILIRLLEINPKMVEATKHLLRLEYLEKGEDASLTLASAVQDRFNSGGIGSTPAEIERVIVSIRKHTVERLPKPEIVEKRSHVLLLTRLFEENLKSGDQASLDLLVSSANESVLRDHPRAFLGLAELAIRNSTGYSDSRCKLVWLAIRLASYCSEYVAGTAICDLVLNDPNAPGDLVQTTHRMKAFMLFEQRRYDSALEGARQAIEMASQQGLEFHRIVSVQNLGGILAHMGQFSEAERCFDEVMAAFDTLAADQVLMIEPLVAVNRCLLYTALGDYKRAIGAFEHAKEEPGQESVYRGIGAAWYGYSLIRDGRVLEAVDVILPSVAYSHRHGFRRQLQIGIDFLAVSMGALGLRAEAQTMLDACAVHRKALHHDRSNLEIAVICQVEGLRPEPHSWETALYANDPLSSLIKFGTDALERAAANG
jgi:tetratricopeptide (TPR) repeat protein